MPPKSSGTPPSMGDDSMNPQERMSKVYQEELAKIMRSKGLPGLPPGFPPPPGMDAASLSAGLPFFPGGLAGSLFQRSGSGAGSQSDLQRAMDIYHQEFSRLQQNALAAALKAQNGTSKGADLPSVSPGSIADANDRECSMDGGKASPDKASLLSPADLGKHIKSFFLEQVF